MLVKVIDPVSIPVSLDLLKHIPALPFVQRVRFVDILVQSHDYNIIHLDILEKFGNPEHESQPDPDEQPPEYELYYKTYHVTTCIPLSYYPPDAQHRLSLRFVRTWPMLWQLYCRHKHIAFGPHKCEYIALQRAFRAFRNIDSKIDHISNMAKALQLMMDQGYSRTDLFTLDEPDGPSDNRPE